MYRRCKVPTDIAYPKYGGMGITIPDHWVCYELFVKDMGHRPPNTELDRIDPSKGYSKDNCKWNTRNDAHRNRKITHYYNGKPMFIHEIAAITGIPAGTISGRMSKYNMTLAQAVQKG
jgi:hypothetical protein